MIAVIYKWKVKEGMNETFINAWETMNKEFQEKHGALDASLHQESERDYVSYVRWPDMETYEKDIPIDHINAIHILRDCVEIRVSRECMEVVSDLSIK